MRNITGSPAEDDDFFDRPLDLERLKRELANDGNVLLTAPRRVGKTSLILRLCEICRAEGWISTFLNVEGCGDELGFAEKIVDGLQQAGLKPEWFTRFSTVLQKFRRALGAGKVGASGINIEMGEADDPDHSTLGRVLESIFRRIEAQQTKVLIAVDEMPELLLALSKKENGDERADHLLHWLRSLRQTHRKQVRWVFLGSIGLDNFVDERRIRKTINDLTPLGLDALTDAEADRFLEILGRDNRLPLSAAVRQAIMAKVGWPLPHHLQVMFHALVELNASDVDPAAVERAFESLLRPENLTQFDTWRQRLDEQLSAGDARAAKTILRHVCPHPKGRTRNQILNALMPPQTADAGAVEDQLAKLLLLLQHDGYLLESRGRYAFRSFLLREFWQRREVK
jgi:hypothetical protein